jgi:aryl-alcohol dehydrogenase-like predicted oxidoreductase
VSVIAGATKPEQVRANAAAGMWEPTPAELEELFAL